MKQVNPVQIFCSGHASQTNFVTYYFPLQHEVHIGRSWQQRYYIAAAWCSTTPVEGGEGIQSRWDCYVEVLECILTWWCFGRDAVRSLHKQFSNSFSTTRITVKANTWPATGRLSSTPVPDRNFSLQYSFEHSRSYLVLDQPSGLFPSTIIGNTLA
jgi:hypothetical protein